MNNYEICNKHSDRNSVIISQTRVRADYLLKTDAAKLTSTVCSIREKILLLSSIENLCMKRGRVLGDDMHHSIPTSDKETHDRN